MKALPRRLNGTGPVIEYLNELYQAGDTDTVEKVHAAVRACLSTPDGAILLDLLVKSTEEYFLPPIADPRALDTLNAQRFIALDLRRIVSNEYDLHKMARQADEGARGRRRPGAR